MSRATTLYPLTDEYKSELLRVIAIPEARLLPALCPHCGAPGTTALALPCLKGPSEEPAPQPSLEVFLCDVCSFAHSRERTLRLAWTLFGTLLGASVATALAFYWGERHLALQMTLVLLIGGSLSVLGLLRSRVRPLSIFELHVALLTRFQFENAAELDPEKTRYLLCLSPFFAQALIAQQFTIVYTQPQLGDASPLLRSELRFAQMRANRPLHVLATAPLLVSVLWWSGLHLMGQATLRFVNTGPGPVVIMLDGRRTLTLPAQQFERPEMGGKVRVLAGPRHLSLLTTSGQILFDGTLNIYPGQTTLLPRITGERCLFQEIRDYRDLNRPPQRTALSQAVEPIVLLAPPDSWFTPLFDASDLSKSETTSQLGQVGTRTAIRLLPCQ